MSARPTTDATSARPRVARARQDRGAVIPLVAFVLPVIILMTAIAVDLGRQRDSRRTAQARADVLALDLVRAMHGRDTCTLIDDLEPYGDPQSIRGELDRSAARNDFDVSRVTGLVWGHLEPDGAFVGHHQPGQYPVEGCSYWPIPDSVRILTNDSVAYTFQPGTGDVNREAVASMADEQLASFMLGSTLVNVTPTTDRFLGRMLSRIIPGADLIGYSGLANAQVNLRDLALALGLGSPDELLDATVTYDELLDATATALDANGDAAGAQVVSDLAGLGLTAEAQDAEVSMGEVLGASTMTPGTGLDGWVSVPQLLAAAVTVADGNHTITIPDTVLDVFGLASVTLELRGIEPAIRIGDRDGASGRTAQVELGITASIDISSDLTSLVCDLPLGERTFLGALLGAVTCLLAPTYLLEVDLTGLVDFQLVLSEVNASQSIDCANQRLAVSYHADPVTGTVDANLAVTTRVNGSEVPVLGVGVPNGTGVDANGAAGTITFQALDEGPDHQDFEWVENPSFYADHGTARVGAPTVGLANLLQVNGVHITVANASLPTLGGIARNIVMPPLNDLLAWIDAEVVAEVSRLLGLNLGGADITPQHMHCEQASVLLVG